MAKQFSVPRGTSDILPQNITRWRRLEETSRKFLETYGYREIRTPGFEETELFARSVGQTSDIVEKQMLNLSSRQEEGKAVPLSLRPEGTAAVVRSYIENNLDTTESLSKLYYIGPMYRGERPQKGRLRQFHQIGVEAIGPQRRAEDDPCLAYLDAEVIALSVNLLKAFGVKGFELKINTLGSAKDKEHFSKYLRDQLKSGLKKLPAEDQKRFSRNIFRILDSKNKEHRAMVSGLKLDGEQYLSQESREYFERVQKALRQLKIDFQVNPSLVRGLDYYTHTVFEISHAGLGAQDALGAGGRYDNLVGQLSGGKKEECGALGFALGIERILLTLPEEEKSQPFDAYVIAMDEESFPDAFGLLADLRRAEFRADMSYRVSSIKSQMRQANKAGGAGTGFVCIIGKEERQKGVVAVKNMETGEQQEIGRKSFVSDFKKLNKKG